MSDVIAAIATAAAALRQRIGARRPEVAVVAGSGLGFLGDHLTDAVRIQYSDIPGFPRTTIEGHKGELVIGTLAGRQVVVQSGRFHLYEGHPPAVVTFPVRVFGELGATTLVVTNAAGGIRRTFTSGGIMLIADHINLTGVNPLTGPVLPGEHRFPDMSDPYDVDLRTIAREVARESGISLQEGVYLGLSGPSYETPAEIRAFERWGADAVGMSTVLEVVVARARGMRCVGFSTVTNPAAGISPSPLSHAEVMAVANRVRDDLGRLVEGVIAKV
jgi:purine-nucleoside phosphorylase